MTGGQKRDEETPAAIGTDPSDPGQSGCRSARETLALNGEKRRIGRKNDDDRTALFVLRIRPFAREMCWHNLRADFTPDRYASNPQEIARTIVCLDQCANRVGRTIFGHNPRTRAGAAFELMADHAGAAANVALR